MVPRGLRPFLALGAVVAWLSGCGGPAAPAGPSDPARPAPPPPPSVDQCGAVALQYLIGQPRTEIPVPVDVTSRRVTCTECPLTEDYSPSRLNILYNRDTGLIERVYCG